MLSSAGRDTGEKELWVTEDKRGKNFKDSGVVRVDAAKKAFRGTKETSSGQNIREVPQGFCQNPQCKQKQAAEMTEG